MTEREKRAFERRKAVSVKKMSLHSREHNSFHIELNCKDAWNLLYSMSIKKWEDENKRLAPLFVDKTIVKKISLKDK